MPDILKDLLDGKKDIQLPSMHLESTKEREERILQDLDASRYAQRFINVGLLRGDVIFVKRWHGLYEHFAVYVGNGQVIHYAPKFGDEDATIHKAPISEFLDGNTELYICQFGKKPGERNSIGIFVPSLTGVIGTPGTVLPSILKLLHSMDYHLYSPEETVHRAESKLGEHEYNLLFNNCEHFAVWCKTGVSESKQVEQLLDIFSFPRMVSVS